MLNLDWQAIGVVFTIAITAVGLVAWAVRAEGRSKANATLAEEARDRADKAHKDIGELRERVAREYVTFSVIKDLEERIMKQFDRLYEAVRNGH